MGVYFLVVNPAKKQYLDAGRFGENSKQSGIFSGIHAKAVGLLLYDTKKQLSLTHQLVGAWVGDSVIVAGDNAHPNPVGIQTINEENPERNLYEMAYQEFEDISREAIIMVMTEYDYWIDELVEHAKSNRWLMIELGSIVFHTGFEPLRKSLEKIVGSDWTNRFKEVCEEDRGRRININGRQHKYRLEVAALPHAPDLAEVFKQSDLQISIDSCVSAQWSVGDAQGIWLGKNVPPEIAVPAIKLAVKEWSFLRYVLLSDSNAPDFVHDEIYFGGSTRLINSYQLKRWSDDDFNSLQPTMKPAHLHNIVKGFYKT